MISYDEILRKIGHSLDKCKHGIKPNISIVCSPNIYKRVKTIVETIQPFSFREFKGIFISVKQDKKIRINKYIIVEND